jgi:hypothetical protein
VNEFFDRLSRILDGLFGSLKSPRGGRAAGRTDGSPPSRSAVSDERIVAHECGHAAIAWLSPAVIRVEGVVFHRQGGAATRAIFNKGHPDYLQENLVYTLGGLVGEILVRKKVHGGGLGGRDEADLPVALDLAERLLLTMEPDRLERQWRGRLAEPSFDVAAMFVRRPPPRVAAMLSIGYRRGKNLLAENRAGFDRLRLMADGRRDLSPEDIASRFGPRLWAPRR